MCKTFSNEVKWFTIFPWFECEMGSTVNVFFVSYGNNYSNLGRLLFICWLKVFDIQNSITKMISK